MKLYLVRHGESTGNLGGTHQDINTPLTDEGRKQAQELGKRFKDIPIQLILTSHYIRALETAKVIAQEINVPFEVNEQLREIKRPSEIEGKPTSDTGPARIMELIKANINDPKWHYSDEENAADLIVRANRFLQDLDKRHETNILAVSHGRIIQAIVEVILLGKALTPEIYQSLKEKLYLSNSGITIVEKENDSWHLVTWNDYAHLENI